MSGQVQLKKYDQESLYDYHSEKLLKQADLYYMQNKFALKTEYDELKTIHSYLLQDILCTDECEIINFLNKKLRGALGDENIDIVDLKTMQTKYRDINNYYVNEKFSWTDNEW